jgi:uncharacterized membrane protein (DUF4010 family)
MAAAKSVSVALLVGLLIGLDRERSEKRDVLRRLGGVRTFPLIALLGAMGSLLYGAMGIWPLALAFVAVSAVVVVAYARNCAHDVGATTEMAALVTFVLGVFAGQGALLLSAAVGVTVAVHLVAKVKLESFSRALTQEEINATLELAVISAIILPLLPNRGFGPYEALNPFKVWMVVVLVSSVSFAGFVAMRLWGARKGLFVTAFVGALVSSTAVTMALAARSRAEPTSARALAAGTVMASTVMCVRVFVLASALGGPLVGYLWPSLAAMTVTGLVATVVLLKGASSVAAETGSKVANPSRLLTALGFGFVYGTVGLLVLVAKHVMGNKGVVAVAALSSVVDVDAISIALAQQARESFAPALVIGVVVAAVTNTWIKGGIAILAGAGRFRSLVAISLGLMGIVGLVTAAVSGLLQS